MLSYKPLLSPAQNILYLIFLMTATLLLFSYSGKVTASSEAYICNKGNSKVYFAAMAWKKNFRADRALVEGFTPIEAGKCASIVPYGMDKIYISIFMYDKNGRITNPILVPTNSSHKPDFIKQFCVRPQYAFRRYSNLATIQKNYTPPCPKGYITAKPSFYIRPSKNQDYILNLNHEPRSTTPTWGAKYGKKRRLQSISAGKRAGQSDHIQENKAQERERKNVQEFVKATKKYAEQRKKRQAEKNARRYKAYIAKSNVYKKKLEVAKKQLEKPGDASCSPLLEKSSYDEFEEATIAGVKINMDLNTAHKAIICHGFTLDPKLFARYGSLTKLLLSPSRPKYFKKINESVRYELEVVIRPYQNAQRGKAYRIISIRKRIFDLTGINNDKWQSIQDAFVKKYDLDNARRTQRFVYYLNRDIGQSLKLDPDLRRNPMTSYTISFCCGR